MNNNHSVPINKTAGLVVSKGFHYEPKITKSNTLHSENILRTIPVPINKNFEDFTGTVFGRFKVVGWSYDKKKRWVVRCSCGNYEVRKTKCIKGAAADQMCIKCYSSLSSIKKSEMESTGKMKNFEDYVDNRN